MPEKKKILFLSNHFITLFFFRKELIKRLCERGHEVYIASPDDERFGFFTDMGCKLIDIKAKKIKSNRELTGRYRKLLKAEKPDVVVTYGLRPNICGGNACRKEKLPHCANIQNPGPLTRQTLGGYLLQLQYRLALRKSKVVFFENAPCAALFRKKKIVKSFDEPKDEDPQE